MENSVTENFHEVMENSISNNVTEVMQNSIVRSGIEVLIENSQEFPKTLIQENNDRISYIYNNTAVPENIREIVLSSEKHSEGTKISCAANKAYSCVENAPLGPGEMVSIGVPLSYSQTTMIAQQPESTIKLPFNSCPEDVIRTQPATESSNHNENIPISSNNERISHINHSAMISIPSNHIISNIATSSNKQVISHINGFNQPGESYYILSNVVHSQVSSASNTNYLVSDEAAVIPVCSSPAEQIVGNHAQDSFQHFKNEGVNITNVSTLNHQGSRQIVIFTGQQTENTTVTTPDESDVNSVVADGIISTAAVTDTLLENRNDVQENVSVSGSDMIHYGDHKKSVPVTGTAIMDVHYQEGTSVVDTTSYCVQQQEVTPVTSVYEEVVAGSADQLDRNHSEELKEGEEDPKIPLRGRPPFWHQHLECAPGNEHLLLLSSSNVHMGPLHHKDRVQVTLLRCECVERVECEYVVLGKHYHCRACGATVTEGDLICHRYFHSSLRLIHDCNLQQVILQGRFCEDIDCQKHENYNAGKSDCRSMIHMHCGHCGDIPEAGFRFHEHLKRSHSSVWLQCQTYKESATDQRQCVICRGYFTSVECLAKHMTDRHFPKYRENKMQSSFIVCCEEKFPQIEPYRIHVAAHHQTLAPSLFKPANLTLTCNTCGEQVTGKQQMYRHNWLLHSNLVHPPPCKKRKHSTQLECREAITCTDCTKTFDQTEVFLKHFKTVHSSKYNHCCDICGQGFLAEFQFLFHLKHRHSMDTQVATYMCVPGCAKSFLRQQSLWQHRSVCLEFISQKKRRESSQANSAAESNFILKV